MGGPKERRSAPQLGAMPMTELMRPPTDGKTHGTPLFLEGGWKSLEGFSARGIRPQVPREISAPSALRRLLWRRSICRFSAFGESRACPARTMFRLPLLRVHDSRSDNAPGWLEIPGSPWQEAARSGRVVHEGIGLGGPGGWGTKIQPCRLASWTPPPVTGMASLWHSALRGLPPPKSPMRLSGGTAGSPGLPMAANAPVNEM